MRLELRRAMFHAPFNKTETLDMFMFNVIPLLVNL